MIAERPERNTSGAMNERAISAVTNAIRAVNRKMEYSDDKTLVSERTYLQGALDTLEFMQGQNNHIAEIVANNE